MDILHQGNGTGRLAPRREGSEAGPSGTSPSSREKSGPGQEPLERSKATQATAEKEMLRSHPEARSPSLRGEHLANQAARSSRTPEVDRREQDRQAQTVANSVFGQDRVTISPEAQIVPGISRKSEAVGVKRMRGKCLAPGLQKLAAKANPAPPAPPMAQLLDALVKNFGESST